jgi:mitochondrial fission protein ELM1
MLNIFTESFKVVRRGLQTIPAKSFAFFTRAFCIVVLGFPLNSIGGTDVWIFSTHLTGALNQRKAVAEYLGDHVEVIEMPEVGKWPTADKWLQQRHTELQKGRIQWPDFIIHSEDHLQELEFLLEIKDRSPKKTKVIYLENPKHRLSEIDFIVHGQHLPFDPLLNDLRPVGVATAVTPERVQLAASALKQKFQWLPNPIVAVNVGGDSHQNKYRPEFVVDLAKRVRSAMDLEFGVGQGSIVLTTSRRTPLGAAGLFVREAPGRAIYFDQWKGDSSSETFYLALLGIADIVIVTGDSLSMMSDALALGKPLYIHAPIFSTLPEHQRLQEELYVRGWARPLTGNSLASWSYQPHRVAEQIARAVQQKFNCEVVLATK